MVLNYIVLNNIVCKLIIYKVKKEDERTND